MEFVFYVNADKIVFEKRTFFSGNVNTYECIFDLSREWDGLEAVALFSSGSGVYSQLITNNHCFIPHEAIDKSGIITIGLVGTNAEGKDFKRLSTNVISLLIGQGAYSSDAEESITPTPDVWEQYIAQMQEAIDHGYAQIADNGNWLLWDAQKQEYADSGKPSRGIQGETGPQGEKGDTGEPGYTPKRGVDYWTQSDEAAISEDISAEVAQQTAGMAKKSELTALEEELNAELGQKQDKLTFDTTPTEDSVNPVTSGGVKAALDGKVDKKQGYGLIMGAPFETFGGGTGISLYFDNDTSYTGLIDVTTIENLINNAVTPKANASDVYTKSEIDSMIGDIETAADNIIALQESYIGGGTA